MIQTEKRYIHLSNIAHENFVYVDKLGIGLVVRYAVSDSNLGINSTPGYGWRLKGLHPQQVVLAVECRRPMHQ